MAPVYTNYYCFTNISLLALEIFQLTYQNKRKPIQARIY